MNEVNIIGEIFIALGTILGVLVAFQTVMKPTTEAIKENASATTINSKNTNELRIEMQRFNEKITAIQENNLVRDKRIEKHGKEIDELNKKVGNLETKVGFYHEK